MRKRNLMRGLAFVLACAMAFVPAGTAAQAEEAQDSVIAPHEAVYGYYVDSFRNNADSNKTPETNPSIGLLSGFSELWKTGTDWHNGEILNESVLSYNFRKTYEIALARTPEEAQKAYEVETGNKQRMVLEGLGEYKDKFIELSGIGTNKTQWSPKRGDDYPLYWTAHIARFVKSSISAFSSTSPAKKYFDCPRPYRWNIETMQVIKSGYEASVLPEIENLGHQPFYDNESSGGFPSGDTSCRIWSGLCLPMEISGCVDDYSGSRKLPHRGRRTFLSGCYGGPDERNSTGGFCICKQRRWKLSCDAGLL